MDALFTIITLTRKGSTIPASIARRPDPRDEAERTQSIFQLNVPFSERAGHTHCVAHWFRLPRSQLHAIRLTICPILSCLRRALNIGANCYVIGVLRQLCY